MSQLTIILADDFSPRGDWHSQRSEIDYGNCFGSRMNSIVPTYLRSTLFRSGATPRLEVALLALVVSAAVLGRAGPAHAYLDPGTGSMVIQLILGGVAGAMVILKLYWTRFKSVLGFSSREVPPSDKAAD